MSWPFNYTPYIWPMLASAVFLSALAVYGYRRRTTPGAFPFVWMMLVAAVSGLGSAAEAASSDLQTKIYWFLFQDTSAGVGVVFALCFALEYAGLGKWVTRRNIALLLVPGVINLLLGLTNETHYLKWTSLWYEGNVRGDLGPVGVVLAIYAMALLFLTTGIFIALFVRSPVHRWPVGLILLGQLAPRVAYPLMAANVVAAPPLNLAILSFNFTAVAYAIALFRFSLFDVVPVGRDTAIERMADGLLILDVEDRIVDLNPAARDLLALSGSQPVGRGAAQVLGAFPELQGLLAEGTDGSLGLTVALRGEPRTIRAQVSVLVHPSGFKLGRLVLLQDVTDQKRARELRRQQQRALAALQERERLARELHDDLGQVIGYVKMQAQATRERLAQDQTAEADEYLVQLIGVAQQAHSDVREYIVGPRMTPGAQSDFLPALEQYLRRYEANHKIHTELIVPPELRHDGFGPMAQAQLLRIIQEALTNVRKHAHARCVQVRFQLEGNQVQVIVQDDGSGFDPALRAAAGGQQFGINLMRERAEEVGGNLALISAPGQGTQVVVQVPFGERHGGYETLEESLPLRGVGE